MTHLDAWVSALVDGRVRPDVAERAHVHLAACERCRAAVAAEREVARRLREAPAPAPSQELVERLLALGGPLGPYASPPTHVPGGDRAVPAAPWAAASPRADRVSRRSALPVAVGAVSLVSIGLLGFLLLGTTWARPAPDSRLAADAATLEGAAALERSGASPAGDGLDAGEREHLRDGGWVCPESLPGGLRLVEARAATATGVTVLHAAYTDGTSTILLVEQQGELRRADPQLLERVAETNGRGDDAEWLGLWQSGDVVVGVLADAPAETVARVLPALVGGR